MQPSWCHNPAFEAEKEIMSVPKYMYECLWPGQKIGQVNHKLSHKICEVKNILYLATGNEPWSVLPPSPNLRNNFVASSKQGCE